MTAQPPPDPRPSRRRLDFDEFIAILVAFGSLGAVLAWGLTRGSENLLANQPGLLPIPGFDQGQTQTTPGQDSGNLAIVPPADNRTGQSRIVPPTGQSAGVPAPGITAPGTGAIVPVPIPGRTNPPATVDRSVTAPAVAPFPDVPSNYWAAPFIAALTQRGDISGFQEGVFRPDQPVTRAEFATLIQEAFDQTEQQAPIAFQDVPGGFWAAGAIDSAVKTGFLKGFPEGTFQPNLPIPRIQALAALSSGLKLAPPANPEQTLQLFSDRSQIPAWGIGSAAAATQAGLVVNHPSPDILNPNQPATRAEVAALLYQALVASGKAEPIASNYIVRP